MKSILGKILPLTLFVSLFSLSTTVSGQAGEMKPGTNNKQMEAESSSAHVKTSGMRGEYTKEVECVDLYVKKGCINYTVSAPNAGPTDKESVVKVCASTKPVNICRKKGSKILSVKYEKLNADAIIDFKPIRSDSKQ